MKRVICLLLLAILAACFAGCGDTTPAEPTSPELVKVPAVEHTNVYVAKETLEKAGFCIDIKKAHFQKNEHGQLLEKDIVISQSVAAGTLMAYGSKVELTYNVYETGFRYNLLEDGSIEIVGFNGLLVNEEGILIVPSEYDGHKVSFITKKFMDDIIFYSINSQVDNVTVDSAGNTIYHVQFPSSVEREENIWIDGYFIFE